MPRRSKYGKRKSYGKRRKGYSRRSGGTYAIAKKALSLAKQATRREKASKQLWPTTNQSGGYIPTAGATEGTSWKLYVLNRLPRGDDETDRIGDNVVGVGLHLRGTIDLVSSPSTSPWKRRFRVLLIRARADPYQGVYDVLDGLQPGTIFQDVVYNEAGATVAIPLHDSGTLMYRREQMSNFHIIEDQIMTIHDNYPVHQYEWNFKVPYTSKMLGSVTTNTEIYENGLYLMIIWLDSSTPPAGGDGQARFLFQSNYTFTTA